MIKISILLLFIYILNLHSVKGVALHSTREETFINHWLNKRSLSKKCGYQLESSPNSNDNSTLPLEYPWVGMLIYQNSSTGNEKFSCNAVLINDKYAITAAECVTSRLLVRMGDVKKVRLGNGHLDCIKNDESKPCTDGTTDFQVERIYMPDNYQSTRNREYDIALLRLDRVVEFTDYIRPVCLPESSTEIEGEQKLRVASWNREKIGVGRVKAQATVVTVENSECNLHYSKVRVNISNKQVCAGVEAGYSACDLISGAPLLEERNGQFIMEGILSFGAHCTAKGWPDVYIEIAKYRDWIDSKIGA